MSQKGESDAGGLQAFKTSPDAPILCCQLTFRMNARLSLRSFPFQYRPNNAPNRLPPARPAPPLLASVSNHCLRNCLSFICSGLVSLVSSCASCLLNARRVGIELIIYVTPKSPMSTESSSTSEYPTPPSASPTPSSSINSFKIGLTVAHVEHHDADQRVMSGLLLLADRRRSVWSSSGVRILLYMRFLAERGDEPLKRLLKNREVWKMCRDGNVWGRNMLKIGRAHV